LLNKVEEGRETFEKYLKCKILVYEKKPKELIIDFIKKQHLALFNHPATEEVNQQNIKESKDLLSLIDTEINEIDNRLIINSGGLDKKQ
jgi:hypothetical protein